MSEGEGKRETGDGATSGSPSPSVAALERTHAILTTIHSRLTPFLQLVTSTDAEADERALARAAIALSIATLRVMGHRLRGQDRGRAPDDPLRQELNRIRAALQHANAKCKAKQAERDTSAAKTKISAEKQVSDNAHVEEPRRTTPNQSNDTVRMKRKESEVEYGVEPTIIKKPRAT